MIDIYTLIIAEKPSVAQSIAKVVGAVKRENGYLSGENHLVSWCIGHMVELAMPADYDPRYAVWRGDDLPILPSPWQYTITERTKSQYAVLNRLMNMPEVGCIICATDAGREGELIFRLMYNQCGCTKPVKRLWISSLEEDAIRHGLESMKDASAYDHLYEAALCRQQADWLVGINASRLYTLMYGTTLNIGRVMTPTLALLVQRERSIAEFQPEKYYVPQIDVGFVAHGERIGDEPTASAIAAACAGQNAVVTSVERQKRRENPPKLYDLTTLQREANRMFGITAQQTLDYAQSLYEKKYITYPRTDSNYLTEDMQDCVIELANEIAACYPYLMDMPLSVHPDNVVCNAKVSDHHAIIPTHAMRSDDWRTLPKSERLLLEMISVRMICAVSNPCIYNETTVTLTCQNHSFIATTKTVTQAGWKNIYRLFLDNTNAERGKNGNVQNDDENACVAWPPDLEIGHVFDHVTASVKEDATTPPKRHTEDSLLAAMEVAGEAEMPEDAERKGLGTPATRAGILEKLVQANYVVRQGTGRQRSLVPTEKGKLLIAAVPEALKSPLLTSGWEQRLKAIERGEDSADSFLADIARMLTELAANAHNPDSASMAFPDNREQVGTCPVCGAPVVIDSRGFFCRNGLCHFGIWKDNRFFATKNKPLTKELVKALLDRRTIDCDHLYSEKSGRYYSAMVTMTVNDEGKPRFTVSFPKSEKTLKRNGRPERSGERGDTRGTR